MSIKALQDYTFTAKYARYLPEKKRRETYKESVDRVREMMHKKYEYADEETHNLIDWAYDMQVKKKVMGSQRALQFGGDPIFSHGARIYNCCSTYIDRVRSFQEVMYLLLCGCGVGFSVQYCHIGKLPNLISDKSGTVRYTIPDTIEGWSDAVGILVGSYFTGDTEFPEYQGKNVEFVYTKIRKKGAKLSHGGKAPGPEPLKKALNNIRSVLDGAKDRLKPIEAYDIIMHASDAVISGGVRRSATLCLFSPEDREMATAKTGNWFVENPQRGRSNNSALLLRDTTTEEQFSELMKSVKEFGEPGFIWSDSENLIVNPCVTSDTLVATTDGLRSVENLIGSRFGALVDGDCYESSEKGFWETGTKDVIELEFYSGRKLRLTPDHRLLTTDGWKEAGYISSEDGVVINNHRPFHENIVENSDYAKGYCLGSFLGDGNITDNGCELKWWGDRKDEYRSDALDLFKIAGWESPHHKEESDSKSIYSCIRSVKLKDFAEAKMCLYGEKHLDKYALQGSKEYLAGLIAGYFDADGSVCDNHNKGCSLRITSNNPENLQNLQIALTFFGINSKIYMDRTEAGYKMLPDGLGGKSMYFCKATHELHISCDSIQQFSKCIPIRNRDKNEKIKSIIEGYKRTPNRSIFVDRIINKRYIGKLPVYDCTIAEVHAFDANGIYAHNCCEIGMRPIDDETGLTGIQGCNLSTINISKVKTLDDFIEFSKAASILGTLQAGFTDFPYLGKVSENIFKRESLLGVSGTGWMDSPEICLNPENQQKAALAVKEMNKYMAAKLGINPAARTTCVKPEGSVSCVLGTASGIHPHHAKRYIRRVQANKMEAIYQHFNTVNPRACEESVWSTNKTDDVISFCVEVADGSKTKNQVTALELLKVVKSTQQNWVIPGTDVDLCTAPWLVHNVSNTINVKPNEWQDVENFIYNNREYFCGISLLPVTGDKDYPQAPFTTVYLPSEMISYHGDGVMFVGGLIEVAMRLWEDNLWAACDSLLGLGGPIKGTAKIEWVDRCKKFAGKYFEDNLRSLTYAMKDVYNYKLWTDLKREYKDVDYTEVLEEEDNTELEQALACVSGKCDL